MRRVAGVLVVVVSASLLGCSPVDGAEWERVPLGDGETDCVAVATDPTDPAHVLAAGRHRLFASRDRGRTWRVLWTVAGHAQIARIAARQDTCLLPTDHGLYASFDGGKHWARTFHGDTDDERRCADLVFHPTRDGLLALGTAGGLFLSLDAGHHWSRAPTPPTARDVRQLAFSPRDPDRLFLITPSSLLIGDLARNTWQERWRATRAEEPEVEAPATADDTVETGEENGVLHHLSALAIDPASPTMLYLAGDRGVARSPDEGLTWQSLPTIGSHLSDVARLLLQHHSPVSLFLASGRDILRVEPEAERWTRLTTGLGAARIRDLALAIDALWAATDAGLYRYTIPPSEPFDASPPPSAQELLANFVNEPTIGQVREAAIRYAEVHPDKIRRWRMDAAWRALFPTVDVGMSQGRTRDASVDEGTFPKFQVIETQDRKGGVDVSVKWDLGDLVWNDAQTAIDVRSKLMVQLRNDIVEEVTRTYFERRRLQVALLLESPEDQQTLAEKTLRIQELTAQLDGLTGGYFSAQRHAGDR